MPRSQAHLHLVSDSTGDTARSVARACLVQFDDVDFAEHFWVLVRTRTQMERVIDGIAAHPGIVLCTVIERDLRVLLEEACKRMSVPFVGVLDPVMGALTDHFGSSASLKPGRQHTIGTTDYQLRIDAMQFVTVHDDGQATWNLNEADVILVGVSRTSKTPTCVYLANRGVKAANVPYVPGVALPKELFEVRDPLVVGLTIDPERLIQIRRNRLLMMKQTDETDYVDVEQVRAEIAGARRTFLSYRWPIIDVTRRSIEETAAAILQLLERRTAEPLTVEDLGIGRAQSR